MTNRVLEYAHENGRRVISLLLLFIIFIYELYTSGLAGTALICSIPFLIVGIYITFKNKLNIFWIVFVTNYIIMGVNRYYSIPVPVTAVTLIPQIVLLIVCAIDIREKTNVNYANLMLLGLCIWALYLVLQIFNQTCSLPISMGDWGYNFTFYSLAFFFSFFLITTMIRTPQNITKLLRIWAYLSIAASLWAWRQATFGWDESEWAWLQAGGSRTHLIGGSVRYFSFFSDAANFGCSIAATAVAFYILAITTKLKKDKILFLLTAICCTYGFFMSGTRSGLLCFLVGVAFYVILSKSIRIGIPVAIIGSVFFFILAFTQVGQGNMQIRRMRSAFDKNDKSANVRDVNKAALKKYLKDAPFGMGFNINENSVPANHKYKIVYETSNDSTYVYLWQRVGIVGAILFAICNGIILLGGSIITMFILKNKACIGIAAAYCCAFLSIHAGGYTNHILLQYPNVLLFYGGMATVYVLPKIENSFAEYEAEQQARQEEKKRLKLEKKLAKRV